MEDRETTSKHYASASLFLREDFQLDVCGTSAENYYIHSSTLLQRLKDSMELAQRPTNELSLDSPTMNVLQKGAADDAIPDRDGSKGTTTSTCKYEYSEEEVAEVKTHYNRINLIINQLYFGCGHIDESAVQESDVAERRTKVTWAIPAFWSCVTIAGWITILSFAGDTNIKRVYQANGICSLILTLYNLYFGIEFVIGGEIHDFVEGLSPRKKVRLMRSNIIMNSIVLIASGVIFILISVAFSLDSSISQHDESTDEAASAFKAIGAGIVISLYFVTNLHLSFSYFWLLYARHTIFSADLNADIAIRQGQAGKQQEFPLDKHRHTVVDYLEDKCATSERWAWFHNIRIILGMVIVSFYVSAFMILVDQPPSDGNGVLIFIVVFIFCFLFGSLFVGVVAAGWYNESFYERIADLLIANELSDDTYTDDLRDFYNSILACNELKGYRILLQYMTLEYAVVVATVTMLIIQYAVALRQGQLGSFLEGNGD